MSRFSPSVAVRCIPNPDELDVDVDRKRLLELVGLLPANIICTLVHLVCKRDLLVVICREQSDFVKHSRETKWCQHPTMHV